MLSRRTNGFFDQRARSTAIGRAGSRPWLLGVLNSLLAGERKGRIAPEQTAAFIAALKILNPALDSATLEQVQGSVQIICGDHRLTPYDALYIELAQRSGCPLTTLDRAQRDAATALGVQCL